MNNFNNTSQIVAKSFQELHQKQQEITNVLNDESNTEEFMRLMREMHAMILNLHSSNKIGNRNSKVKIPKPKKEVIFNRYSPEILKIMSDGKIWCIDAVYEELLKKGVKVTSRQSCCNVLSNLVKRYNKITRISHGAYRIKEGSTW